MSAEDPFSKKRGSSQLDPTNQSDGDSVAALKVPKVVKSDDDDDDQYMVEFEVGVPEFKALVSELQLCCGRYGFDLDDGEILAVMNVSNAESAKRFGEYAARLREEHGESVRIEKAFAISTIYNGAQMIASSGVSLDFFDCSKFSHVIGNPASGIHLFNDPMAAIEFQMLTEPIKVFEILMFRIAVCNGKQVSAIPVNSEKILEPQPQFDHHTGMDHSDAFPNLSKLLYLYEYNDDCEIERVPSCVLAHAVFTYRIKNIRKWLKKVQFGGLIEDDEKDTTKDSIDLEIDEESDEETDYELLQTNKSVMSMIGEEKEDYDTFQALGHQLHIIKNQLPNPILRIFKQKLDILPESIAPSGDIALGALCKFFTETVDQDDNDSEQLGIVSRLLAKLLAFMDEFDD